MLISLVGTSTFAQIYLYGRGYFALRDKQFLLVLVFAWLFFIVMFSNFVILVYALEFWVKGIAPGAVVRISKLLGKGGNCINRCAAERLFGLEYSDTFQGGIREFQQDESSDE